MVFLSGNRSRVSAKNKLIQEVYRWTNLVFLPTTGMLIQSCQMRFSNFFYHSSCVAKKQYLITYQILWRKTLFLCIRKMWKFHESTLTSNLSMFSLFKKSITWHIFEKWHAFYWLRFVKNCLLRNPFAQPLLSVLLSGKCANRNGTPQLP